MPLKTTTIGSYPKPDYVPVVDWFRGAQATHSHPTSCIPGSPDSRLLIERGIREITQEQIELGIELPTDGEVSRENYLYYHCRHLSGIDFERTTHKSMRAGTWQAEVPTVVAAVRAGMPFLEDDWRAAAAGASRPVKITVPGPLTLADSLYDAHYGDETRLCEDLARAINAELKALTAAGCRHIQIDEPVFAREPEKALRFGLENIARCCHGLGDDIWKSLHICCGYPDGLDREDYPKADRSAYHQLAPSLDELPIAAVALEDAQRFNDLELFARFRRLDIILGVVAIARTRVEPVDEIIERVKAVSQRFDVTKLMLAPDCGLAMLDRATVRAKLTNLVQAAQRL